VARIRSLNGEEGVRSSILQDSLLNKAFQLSPLEALAYLKLPGNERGNYYELVQDAASQIHNVLLTRLFVMPNWADLFTNE